MKFARSYLAAAVAFAAAGIGGPTIARGDEPLTDNNAALQYWQAFGMMTDGTKKLLEDVNAVKFEGDVLEIVGDRNPRLLFLYAGAAMPRCDWGLDFRQGPETLMPHLRESRELARLAILRARYRFENNRFHDGLDDVLAAFELAKDTGDTPVIISILVRYGEEQLAIETVARYLPKMDRATLDDLAKSLEAMPAPDALKRVWPQESKYFLDWTIKRVDQIEKDAGGDAGKWAEGVLSLAMFTKEDAQALRKVGVPSPAKIREIFGLMKGLLVGLSEATDLPTAEQNARLDELQKPFRGDPVMKFFIPDQNKIFLTRRRWQVRHAMLKAAVAIRRDGETMLKEKRYADPFGGSGGDEPFTYRKADGGFELESKLMYDGKPVVLTVGPAPAKP